MAELADALAPEKLGREGFGLYEQFRPEIPGGVKGWGAKREFNLRLISTLLLKER